MFLRLRKAYRKHALKVFAVAPFATPGLDKLGGTLLPTPARRGGGRARHAASATGRSDAGAPRSCWRAGRRDPGRRAARRRPRRADRRGAAGAGDRRPARPGCRAGRASAARSRRGRCRACCRSAARSTDPAARAEVAARLGRARRCPTGPARDAAGILAAARRRGARRAARRRRRPLRPAGPGRRCCRALEADAVRGQPGAAAQRGHRPRRRRVPGRGRRGEVRHVRRLGGPRPPVRHRAQVGGPHERPGRAATPSPTRWTSTSACPTPRRRAASWPSSAPAAASGPARPTCRRRWRRPRAGRGAAGDVAAAARPRPPAGR